jgi:hypothetical protein
VDFAKNIYVLEGPIDSLFLDNSVAAAGSLSNINTLLKFTPKDNIIIVPDNDRRNKQTERFTADALAKGFKLCLWPDDFKYKDLNDAITKGVTKESLFDIITRNTFDGLMGITKFKMKG